MQKPLGGQRLGSGGNMNIDLHNFGRSNHNLTKDFRSSLAPGVLYPAYVNIGLNGDKFKVDIESITRTLPTKGPLFGTFKMQVDMFVCPIRLYHGILHNNPINIGLKMNQVKLPIFKVNSNIKRNGVILEQQIHPSNLWKYLGLSGLGRITGLSANQNAVLATRKMNGVPLLAYYDIFKNYYANKQEENAFVISTYTQGVSTFNRAYISKEEGTTATSIELDVDESTSPVVVRIEKDITRPYLIIEGNSLLQNGEFNLKLYRKLENTSWEAIPWSTYFTTWRQNNSLVVLKAKPVFFETEYVFGFDVETTNDTTEGIHLKPFKLENIDKMRELLLNIKMGETFDIADNAVRNGIATPYTINSNKDTLNSADLPMNGLCVKTYQSDMFNNWLNSETITGSNGIAEITTVDTSNGLQMDALNLAQKVYNMLNRIAVAGGTYEDWQEAVYSQKTIRKAETPIYVGGMSCEVVFEEVVATTAAETSQDGQQSIGSLGGRGKQANKKGGQIEFEIEEPSIIMAIASLTPRVTYSQGNKWYLTELESMDDLHKPDLDGIGFQDLMAEQMVWTGTQIDLLGNVVSRNSVGKSVAWLNYMSDVDECYGDFAQTESYAYMVLNRNYDININATGITAPSDITTYIDPSKFNYAFAYANIDAQNFWTEILFKIEARRVMSAKQIPNL